MKNDLSSACLIHYCSGAQEFGPSPKAFRWFRVRLVVLFLVGSGFWQVGSVSQAATLTWDTVTGDGGTITGGTGTWTDGLGNWNTGSGDTVWNSATPDSAIFGGTAGTVTLGGAVTVGNIVLNSGYTLADGGNALTLSNSTITATTSAAISAVLGGSTGLIKDGIGTLSLWGASTYTGGTTISGGALKVGNGATSGALSAGVVTNNGGLIFNRSDVITPNNQIIGTGSVSQIGSGTVIFTSTNTYSGGTSITAGSTLQMGNGGTTGQLGTGAISNNGSIVVNRSDLSAVIGGVISGTGTLTQAGAGRVSLNSANSYTGATIITGGTLFTATLANGGSNSNIGASTNAAANLVLDGGKLQYGGANTSTDRLFSVGTGGGTFDLSATINFTNTGSMGFNGQSGARTLTFGTNVVGATILAAIVGDSGGATSLTKTGTGTLALTGQNTYSGTTTISAGTLQLGTGGALGTGNIVNNGTLILANVVGPTLSQTISGTGGISINAGSPTLSGTNTYTGVTTIAGGANLLVSTIGDGGVASNLGAASNAAGNIVLSGNGGLNYVGTGSVTNTDRLFSVGVTGGTLASQGTGAINFTNTGSMGFNGFSGVRTLTLTGANTGNNSLAAAIGDNGGATSLTKSGASKWILTGANTYSGTTTISGGVLQVGNGGTSGTLGTGGVTNNSSLVINRSDTVTLANAISGTGTLTQAGGGTTILTNSNNFYSGTTTISAGVLQIGNGGTSGKLGTGSVVNNGSLVVNRSDALTISGVINGSGSFTQAGTGTTTFNNVSMNYTGATLISAGQLTATSGMLLLSGSAFTISSGGTLNMNGSNWNIGSLSGSGTVLGAGSVGLPVLSMGFDHTSTTFSGVIQDAGTAPLGLTKGGVGTQTLTGLNTYTGVTKIGNGVVSVATLTNGGISSNIGAATNAASNLILNGGTLQYTGAAVSTDRLFMVGTASGALDASGTGAVSFTNTGSMGYFGTGIRTLTLAGTNTGGNTIAAVIGDNSGATALTKSGAGTWVLTGTNTYSGVTTISGGVLTVSNLANGGSNSNIGASSSAATNLVLNGGTLRYSPGAASAVSTDRLFSVGTSGGTIDASSGFNINFTNSGSMGFNGQSGARTLTLTGNNANDNTLAAVIGDNGGATSVTKAGGGIWVLSGASAYTGVTTMSGTGVLKVSSLANGGSASSIGASTNAASNLVLNGGTFMYTGSTVSTDRLFSLGTSGATLNVFGSGAVTFTNTGSMGFNGQTGARTLTLANASGGTSTIAAVIGDNGGPTSLTRINAGIWALTGASTYTGVTTINGSGGTILNVTNLANGGVASNIGAATNAATNLILNGGTLQYTGAGSSTDRLFSLGTNGISLEASGTGDLKFTNTGSMGFNNQTGARTLNLIGSYLGFNTLAAVIGDNGGATSVSKFGSGKWVLTGNNTYSGTTTISGGVLQLGHNTASGTTGTGNIVNNGILVLFRSDAFTLSNVISGTGTVSNAQGVATLSGLNTYTGFTSIVGGTVVVDTLANGGSASNIGASTSVANNLQINGGTLKYIGAGVSTDRLFSVGVTATIDASGTGALNFTNTGLMGRTLTSARTLTLTGTNTNNNTLAAIISDNTGATSLVKSGTGTWVLSGANTYTGTTTISAGVLQIGSGGTSGTLGIGAVTDNASLVFNRSDAVTLANTITGTGTFTQAGSGTTTFTGTKSYSGATFVNAGKLQAGGANAFSTSSAVTVASGAVLELNGFTNAIGGLAGSGTVQNGTATFASLNVLGSATSTFSGIIQDGGSAFLAFNKGGLGGTLTLTGSNTYTGGTVVSAGVLSVSSLANGGTASNIGASTNAASSLILTGGTLRYTGAAVSTDRLFTVTTSGGTLDASGSGAVNFTNSGSMGFNSQTGARILTLTGTNTDSNTIAAAIGDNSGATTLVKTGTGTWVLSGTNTYTGTTTISGGSLQIGDGGTTGSLGSGAVTNNASLVVNRSDAITIANAISGSGSLTQAGAGTTILTGTNNYGSTTISAGTLQIGNGGTTGSLGGIGTITNNGKLVINRSDAITISGAMSGTGDFIQNGTGTTTLSNFNQWGSATVNAGILTALATNSLGTTSPMTVNAAGTLVIRGLPTSAAVGSLSGSGVVKNGGATASTLTVGTIISGTTAFSGTIIDGGTGTMALDKGGPSYTLNLSGLSTYTGPTRIFAGTLSVSNLADGGSASSIGASASAATNLVFKTFTSVLKYTGAAVSTNRLFSVSGGGTLDASGTGALNLTNTGAMGFDSQTGARTLTLTGTNTDSNTLAAVIGDNGGATSLIKSGVGTWVLAGANTYTGTTVISAGELQIGNGGTTGSLGSGAVTNNGKLTLNRSDAFTVANTISGNGTLTQAGTGTATLSGTNSYTGATTITSGVLNVTSLANGGSNSNIGASSNAATNLVLDGGTLQYTGSANASTDRLFSVGTGGGVIDVSGSGTLNFTNTGSMGFNGESGARTLMLTGTNTTGVNIIAAAIGDFGGATSVTIDGDATWLLTGANTYTGATTLSSGVLQIGGSILDSALIIGLHATLELNGLNASIQSLAGSGTVRNNSATAATLTLGGNNSSTAFSGTIQDGGTGALSLLKLGTGTFTISGNNTYSGTTTISAGVLQIGTGSTSGTLGTGNVINNASLTINRSDALTVANAISGSGALTQAGSGATTLTGDNSYSGSTTINAGVLSVSVLANGGVSSNLGASTNAAANLVLNGGTLQYTGGATSTDRLFSIGSSGGTLDASGTGAVNFTNTGSLDFNGQSGVRTLTLTGTNTGDNIVAAIIGDNGDATTLTKSGAGTWVLSGANTYTGATTISEGVLQIGNGGTTGSLSTSSVLNNNGTLAFNRTDAVTQGTNFASVISGSGGVTQAGSGTLTLNGDNTYTGTTNVRAGTLEVTGNNALGTGAAGTTVSSGATLLLNNVNYSTSEALTLNGSGAGGGGALRNSGTSTFTGAITAATNASINAGGGILNFTGGLVKDGTVLSITGGGTVNVSGTGISGASASSDLVVDGTTLVVSADSDYNGPTTVQNSAVLIANAAVTTTRLDLSSDSLLAGTGAITTAANQSMFINGTFSVGDPGVAVTATNFALTTSGSGAVVMGADSVIRLDLFSGAGLGNNTGNTTAADSINLHGKLDATAGGTVVIGNPNGMTNFRGGDQWQLVHLNSGDANAGSFAASLALNDSSLHLASGFTSYLDQSNGVFSIIDTNGGLALAAVEVQALVSGGNTVTSDLNGHLFNLRAGGGEEGDDSGSITAALDDGVIVGEGDGDPKKASPIAKRVARSRQWEVFATVNYGNVKLNPIRAQSGVQIDSWASGVGAERHFSRGLTLGFAASFLQSSQGYTSNAGSVHLEGPALSAYVSYVRGGFWNSLLYSFGTYQMDSIRNTGVAFPTAFGTTRTYTHSVQYNTGWNMRFQNDTLVTGPFAGVDYLHGSVDAYNETGGGLAALHYSAQSYQSLVSRVGWSASKQIKASFGTITPQVRLSYERQNIKSNNGTSVSLINVPFSSTGGQQAPGQDYLVAGLGVSLAFNDRFSLMLSYQGQFFRHDLQAHFGSIRFSYQF